MIGRKQKKILGIYDNHVVNQEAEINQLTSLVSEYRNKFGDIGIKDSLATQKADFEKQLQTLRQRNQSLMLSISTKENELIQYQSSLKQLDDGLKSLASQNEDGKDTDVTNIQSEIDSLETKLKEIDIKIKEGEEALDKLLSTKKIESH